MISPEAVQQLTNSPERKCLTLYFETGPSQPRSAFKARFHNLLKGLNGSVPAADRKAFDKAVAQVLNFLDALSSTDRSVLLFATEKDRQEFTSRVPVRDEIAWGAPNTNQLLWLLDEYRPYGLLIAEQQLVRFLAVRLNEFEEYKEFTTDIDTSEWRKHEVGTSGRVGPSNMQRGGNDVDKFSSHMMERVRAFWGTLDKPLSEMSERYHIQRLVVAGNKSLVPEFMKSLPLKMSNNVIAQVHLEAFTSPGDAVKHTLPVIEAWERGRESVIVAELLDAAGISAKAGVGIEPTLKFVQSGRAARLVMAKDFDQGVSECAKCRYVSANPGNSCSSCTAVDIEKATLAAVLPRLVAQHRVQVEVVKGPAADELNKAGGIGVFLRF
jgi:ribosomal protein L7Ae-like RNA K-turn-binding protein